ncbi:MAG: RHS repeat domain-containing protein [Flavobacterium sp.]|uniref:RHS repeat domain-containing protein n=1 Tax=Flavobacterium sp. TaxID=239 RepID=UPI003BA600FF
MVKFGSETLVINYAYQYKDHLGNIRLNYGKDPETNVLKVLEENHYYPFGLKHQNYNTGRKQYGKKEDEITTLQFPGLVLPTEEKPMVYKYKYNGKEWQDELGLNLTAMDFRMYDNAIGRFHNIDAMADIMPSLSPYRFAFNNPVIWKDPTGLLEKNGDPNKTPHWDLDEVVVSAKARTSEYANMPASFTYHLLDGKDINRNYIGSLDDYNRDFGTNYYGSRALDQWYYKNHYLPFKQDMIKSMHEAQAKVGMAIMAVVGSVFAAPILAASSPAAISSVSATISHPLTQYSFSMGLASAFSQQLVKGEVDQADVAISMIPGGSGVQALKPMFSSAIDLSSKEGFKLAGINKSDTSFYRDAATGYIFHGLSFGASPANDLRGLGEIPLNTVLNTGQDSMNKMLELQGLK